MGSPLGSSASHDSGQHAQVALPVAAVEDKTQLSGEFASGLRSQRVLAGLHAAAAAAGEGNTAAEDEQSHSGGDDEQLQRHNEGGLLQDDAADEPLHRNSTKGGQESQDNAEGERLQSSTQGEQAQSGADGEQTQGSAERVEGGAVGGAAGMLAALQSLDDQPEAAQLPGDIQTVSNTHMHSRHSLSQEASHTQQQSSATPRGQPENTQPSVHSSMQEQVAATAVLSESEQRAESARGEASGSLGAGPAADAVVPPLLIAQVGALVFDACIVLKLLQQSPQQ